MPDLQPPSTAPRIRIGVGLDTARYGHHVSFLGEDRQVPARDFSFPESREGYDRLGAAFRKLAERHGGNVHFHIHLDAAGNYAVNLEAYLRTLPFPQTISIGEPKRNKDYRNAHFPKRKADQVDSQACARFAMVERPAATPETAAEFLILRELAGSLQAQRKQTTRCVNQLHNHLARVFPELPLLAPDLSVAWVLKLLDGYPTPKRVAAAHLDTLTRIPHLGDLRAEKLQAAARTSTASLAGELAEQVIRQAAAEVRHSADAELRLEKLLEQAFDALPEGGHRRLLSIPGIGRRSAAALVAKIVSIDRFKSPASLVNYFGFFPEENTSGVDKHGRPVACGTPGMSPKGNDLVRSLLWMACQSAIQCNPALRALYARQKAAGKRGDVALGHCARKLLHLVYAVWKTNRPFDPDHFDWEQRHAQATAATTMEQAKTECQTGLGQIPAPQATPASPVQEIAVKKDAAGHTGLDPEQTVVTAAPVQQTTRTVPRIPAEDKPVAPQIRFAELRRQVRMEDVLEHLGHMGRLHGTGPQRGGPCPVHEPDQTGGRHFSVNLDKHVFQCFHPACRAHGNVLDLWAAVKNLPLREAALDLAATLGRPSPPPPSP